jgi:hypothetical protein
MAIITTATTAVTTKLLTPIIASLLKTAKDGAIKGLKRWQQTTFPKRLAKSIEQLGKVKTLWSPEDEISLTSFYHPPNIIGLDKHARKAIDSIREISEGNVVIQGIVGQGKSILLRYLAIREITNNERSRIPIFLELRMLQPTLTLIPSIKNILSGLDIEADDDTFAYVASSGKFVLLLDAFDELDESLIKTTLNDLAYLTQKFPELQIIITSRPGNEIQKVGGYRVIRIAPLTRLDYGPFLTRLGLAATKVAAIREAIRESPSKLSDLITTPLMLTLVVIVYESEKEIPPTLPEFFERLFQVVFTRHDRLKAGFNRKRFSGLSERRLQTLFEAFCFMVLQNSFGRSLTAEQFSTAFSQALEYSDNCGCEEEKFRLDIAKVACLMLEEGLDATTFLHKSVLEYYASAFIKHSTDEVALLFYNAANNSPRTWSEVIRFLSDIDPYRYSRDFAISELNLVRKEFIEPTKSRTNTALLQAIQKLHPSFGVSYQRVDDESDNYRISSFGPFNGRPRLIYESLDSLLISAAEDSLPQYARQSELAEILNQEIDETISEEIEIPLHRIIASAGAEDFWKAIDIFSSKIDQAEAEANAIIANQEKRKLIFMPRQKKLDI